MKSHVPLTCEEHKKENGISERRVIEEARTEALIRTCNKCKVRILKEDGCNKVICTSCYAVLCDYCGNDITKAMYNHFDNEGGRAPHGPTTAPGKKCPLYDESNKRKDRQVDAAEKEAMEKVRAEHPELTEEDLKIRFAAGVHQSSNRNHRHRGRHHPEFFGPLPENGIGNPPPLQFGPRFGDEHPNMMGAVPGAFPAMIEEQQRLQQQHQQHQAAYRAYMQAQLHQQQMQQRLQQVRMQQEVLARRAQDYVDRNQDRAREDLIPNGQDMRRDRAPFGAGGAFGEERQYGNHGQVMSDQSRFNDRPNEPAHRRHAPPDRPAEVPNGRLHLVAPPPGARQAEDAARRAQRVRDDIALLQNRLEEAEELRQRRQRRPPREPIRRNAMTIDDEFFAAPFPNNPWV